MKGFEMSERFCLDEVLARHGATFEDVKAACVLDNWEVRAIERGFYGLLRLSSATKMAQAICSTEDDVSKASKAIILSLADEDAGQCSSCAASSSRT